MASNLHKLAAFSGAAVVLSTLTPTVLAQAIIPSTAPANGADVPAAVPAPIAPPQVATARPMVEMMFQDVDVSELIAIISRTFNVQVVTNGDISGIKISFINLTNKTPEAAIQAVATVAGLKYRKSDDGTFLIGKNLADDANIPAPLPSTITQGGANSNWNNPSSTIFGPNPAGVLPAMGGDSAFASNANGDFQMPALIGNTDRTERKRTQALTVRNVPAQVMAYWLDPADNDVPVQFQVAQGNNDRYRPQPLAQSALTTGQSLAAQVGGTSFTVPQVDPSNFSPNPYTQGAAEVRALGQFGGGRGGGGRGGGGRGGRGGAGGGVFQLPEGVDRIVAIDPQNALLVFGTDDGIRDLQRTIAFLDRPLRQVEIEAQFVRVSTSDSRQFGIDYSTARGNFNASNNGFAATPSAGSFNVGFVRGNFQATLSALLAKNRAKVITAPRVTAINNLTASLISATSSPILLTSVSQNINGNQAAGQNLLYVTTSIGLTVTPTINNDDTVTVLMQPQLQSQADAGLAIAAPIITSQTLQTIANVRDGETIALGGLKSATISRGGNKIPLLGNLPLIGSLFTSRRATDSEDETIIFLKATILRRQGDDDPTAGAG